jgi:hypothetical protein
MEMGKGYMIKRQADDIATFFYPLYWDNNRYNGSTSAMAPRRAVSTSTTMNIVASVEGVETELGDVLVVYRGAERMAEAVADDEQNYYLNIGSDTNSDETLTFILERDDQILATTGSKVTYEADCVLGTPDEPTAINFTAVDPAMLNDGKWYTISGIELPSKPATRGAYINNGKVIFINK